MLVIFTATIAFAQSNYQDVVYLKNGSIIRGVIIEQIPNQSLKIKTAGGSLFMFKMNEVEKIEKYGSNLQQVTNTTVTSPSKPNMEDAKKFDKQPENAMALYYSKAELPVNITHKGQNFRISDFSITQSKDTVFVKVPDLPNFYFDNNIPKNRVGCTLIINGKEYKGDRFINVDLKTDITIFKFLTSDKPEAVIFYPGDDENKKTIIKLTTSDLSPKSTPLPNTTETVTTPAPTLKTNASAKLTTEDLSPKSANTVSEEIDKTQSGTVEIKFENTTYQARIGKIGKDENGNTTVELLGRNLENIPVRNGKTVLPVEMNIIVNGKTISHNGCDAGKTYLFHFETKEKPEKIIIFGNDGTNSSTVVFDGATKSLIYNPTATTLKSNAPVKLIKPDLAQKSTPSQNKVTITQEGTYKTVSETAKVKFENTTYQVRVGKIGKNENGYTTIELLFDNLDGIPIRNSGMVLPVEMKIIVNGKTITRGDCDASTNNNYILYHFETKEMPEKITIFGNDCTNSSIVTFDGKSKKIITNEAP